jgi:hypothetical protein
MGKWDLLKIAAISPSLRDSRGASIVSHLKSFGQAVGGSDFWRRVYSDWVILNRPIRMHARLPAKTKGPIILHPDREWNLHPTNRAPIVKPVSGNQAPTHLECLAVRRSCVHGFSQLWH